MKISIVSHPLSLAEITQMATAQFGDFIKGVVDIDKQIVALGGELHADAEALLLDQGSVPTSLWGISLYPSQFGAEDFIEFDSMINIRPSQNNYSRSVESADIQEKIKALIAKLVTG